MKTLALTLLYTLSKADEITETNIYTQERNASGFTVVSAQNQDQCDERTLSEGIPGGYDWDEDACACVTQI